MGDRLPDERCYPQNGDLERREVRNILQRSAQILCHDLIGRNDGGRNERRHASVERNENEIDSFLKSDTQVSQARIIRRSKGSTPSTRSSYRGLHLPFLELDPAPGFRGAA